MSSFCCSSSSQVISCSFKHICGFCVSIAQHKPCHPHPCRGKGLHDSQHPPQPLSGGLTFRSGTVEEVQPGLRGPAVGVDVRGTADVRWIIHVFVSWAERLGEEQLLWGAGGGRSGVTVGLWQGQTDQPGHVSAAVNWWSSPDPESPWTTLKVEICGQGRHLPGKTQ